MIGDISNTYRSGWERSSDGTTNKLFWTDSDGSHEIKDITTSLFGNNETMDGFASDYKNQKVYLHDEGTKNAEEHLLGYFQQLRHVKSRSPGNQ